MNADEFNALTDTGKFRAVTEQEARANTAEAKLLRLEARLRRHALGLLELIVHYIPKDDIMARMIEDGEKKT